MNDLTCYVSAPFYEQTALLKELLQSSGVSTTDVYDVTIGQSITQVLKTNITKSDFAIFVFNQKYANSLFEIGICEGLGKPYFILVEKDLDIPSDISNVAFLRTDLKNKEFLKKTIEAILVNIQSQNRRNRLRPSSKEKYVGKDTYPSSIINSLISYRDKISSLREGRENGFELESLLEDIFKSIKLTYVENSKGRDRGVDFAIWNDELGKVIGNPIIIELKSGIISNSRIKEAERQLDKYIKQTDAKIALLLYLDKENRRHTVKSSLQPLILGFDLEDFINELINHSFERVILNQRNKIAHGIE